jgi:hypothetical protein
MIYSLLTKDSPNYIYTEIKHDYEEFDLDSFFIYAILFLTVALVIVFFVFIFRDYLIRMQEMNTFYCTQISTTNCK